MPRSLARHSKPRTQADDHVNLVCLYRATCADSAGCSLQQLARPWRILGSDGRGGGGVAVRTRRAGYQTGRAGLAPAQLRHPCSVGRSRRSCTALQPPLLLLVRGDWQPNRQPLAPCGSLWRALEQKQTSIFVPMRHGLKVGSIKCGHWPMGNEQLSVAVARPCKYVDSVTHGHSAQMFNWHDSALQLWRCALRNLLQASESMKYVLREMPGWA